jgi:hypothetical protein
MPGMQDASSTESKAAAPWWLPIQRHIQHAFRFAVRISTAPISSAREFSGLSWQEIVTTYIVVIFTLQVFVSIFSGFTLPAILAALGTTLVSLAFHAVVASLVGLGLYWSSICKNFREFCESYLRALVPALVLAALVQSLAHFLLATQSIGLTILTTVIAAVLFGYLMSIALAARFALAINKARIVAGVVAALFLVPPLYLLCEKDEPENPNRLMEINDEVG